MESSHVISQSPLPLISHTLFLLVIHTTATNIESHLIECEGNFNRLSRLGYVCNHLI